MLLPLPARAGEGRGEGDPARASPPSTRWGPVPTRNPSPTAPGRARPPAAPACAAAGGRGPASAALRHLRLAAREVAATVLLIPATDEASCCIPAVFSAGRVGRCRQCRRAFSSLGFVWPVAYVSRPSAPKARSRASRRAMRARAGTQSHAASISLRCASRGLRSWVPGLPRPGAGVARDTMFLSITFTISNSPLSVRTAFLVPAARRARVLTRVLHPPRSGGAAERRQAPGCSGIRRACHDAARRALAKRPLRPVRGTPRLAALHLGTLAMRIRASVTRHFLR